MFRVFLSIGLFGFFTIIAIAAGSSSAAERPNVLFVIVDDLRPELGDQLNTLAKELLASDGKRGARKAHGGGPAIAVVTGAKSKGDAIDTLLIYHTAAAPLTCPKCIQPRKKAKGGQRF